MHFKTLLLLSQFLWPRSNFGPHKLLCKYIKLRSTCKQNGLAVSMEFWNRERNLINIEIQHTSFDSGHDCSSFHTNETGSLNNKKTIAYSEHALKTIGKQVQQDQRLRLLPSGAISTIGSLRINCKPQKRTKDKRTPFKQYRVDKSNLINIKKMHESKHGNITIATCNIQSVPKKELQVSDLISDYSLDLLVLTKTWLTSNHGFWKDTTQLNRNNLKLYTADRPQGRGGGLTLIANKDLTVSQQEKGTKPSFEFAHWSVKCREHNTKHTWHLPPSLLAY